MFVVTRRSLLKVTKPKFFFARICKKLSMTFFENVYLSSGTTTSGICLVKSQGFASSVPFNAIEMV